MHSNNTIVTGNANEFISGLRSWYLKNFRKLPWRENPSLYKTVVSEFMLQQTQVDTVLPYFTRWLSVFPDFATLAVAGEDEVVKHWEGLGYYRRARNLHKLAQALTPMASIPTDPKAWLAFPGVGPYTSAAITSIAFKVAVPVVDGNLIRILARIFAIGTSFKDSTQAMKYFYPLAEQLLDINDPGTHNEAMMELGATVCSKTKPLCPECPVSSFCKAYQAGSPEAYPRLERKQVQQVAIDRAWVFYKNKVLLHQIPKDAKRLSSLSEFPTLEHLALKKSPKDFIFSKKRGISNQRITEHFYSVHVKESFLQKVAADPLLHWVGPQELNQVTLSGPHRKWLRELSQEIF